MLKIHVKEYNQQMGRVNPEQAGMRPGPQESGTGPRWSPMSWATAFLVALALFSVCRHAGAVNETPVGKIAYQGRLTDNNNNPISGNQSIRFSIWDGPDGTDQELWNETQSLDIDRGLISVNLGDVSIIPSFVFQGATTWLEIKVGADSAMTPRVRLLPAPYALNSESFSGHLFSAVVATFSAQTIAGLKTFSNKLNITDGSADALKVTGGITAGSGVVGIVDTSGKIPSISGTYFASLDGSNLTNLPGSSMGAGSTNYIHLRESLQEGSTFYVSSATVQNSLNLRGNLSSSAGATLLGTVYLASGTVYGTLHSTTGFTGVGSSLTLNASLLNMGLVPNARIDVSSIAKWNASGQIDNFRLDPSSVAMWNAAQKIDNFRLDPSSIAMWNGVQRIDNWRLDNSSVAKWNANLQIDNWRLDNSSVAKWNASGDIDNFRLDPSSVTLFGPVRSRSVIGIWQRVNLAANITDSQLLLVPLTAAVNSATNGSQMVMPFNGIVRGVIASGEVNCSQGSATFQVFKNGSTDVGPNADAIISLATPMYAYANAGNYAFNAGDRLDIRVTTSSDFLPAGSVEYLAQIVVEWTQ